MLFVGCVLIGIGVGMVFDEVAAGAVIGIGLAFVLAAVLAQLRRPARRRDRVD